MTAAAIAYVALGANLGDRSATLESAIGAIADLPRTTLRRRSSVIETDAIGPPGQGRFLNAVVSIETGLDPRGLLRGLHAVEAAHGRRRDVEERWGPRRLDLDLLLFGDHVIDEPGLTVPHPRIAERAFVLEPLAELCPDLVHPVLGLSVRALLARLLESERGVECDSDSRAGG